LLWLRILIDKYIKFELNSIFDEFCLFSNDNEILMFFYVKNIVFAFKASRKKNTKNLIHRLNVNREPMNSFTTRSNWPKKDNSVKYTTLHAIQLYKHHSLNSTVRRDLTTISLLRQNRSRASGTASLTEFRQDQSRLKVTIAKSSRAKITEFCLLVNHK
jgi:hypothetical protein